MTDPEFADATYEPLTTDIIEKIIIKKNLMHCYQLGGQTALN